MRKSECGMKTKTKYEAMGNWVPLDYERWTLDRFPVPWTSYFSLALFSTTQ